MAWIKTVLPEDATGNLKEIYQTIGGMRGAVADVHCITSLNPRAMREHFEFYKAIMFQHSSLSRIDRERIGVVVSHSNHCRYCINHHQEALQRLNDESHIIDSLGNGELPTTLTEKERLLLVWCKSIAETPSKSSKQDTENLREAGYDDRAILDASLTASYFSFVNRLVLSLGVELETNFAASCGAMQSDE